MEKVFPIGVFFSFLCYLFTAMYNHTWDIMAFDQCSTFVCAGGVFMSFAMPAMIFYLNGDFEKPKQRDRFNR